VHGQSEDQVCPRMTVFQVRDQVVDQPMRTRWIGTGQGMCPWHRKTGIASDDTLIIIIIIIINGIYIAQVRKSHKYSKYMELYSIKQLSCQPFSLSNC